MNIKNFNSGTYQKGFRYQYFVPSLINHSFYWNDEGINELLERASLALGELNSFSRFVPDTDRFIIMHVMKEAVLSNRIEGTQTKIDEAFTDENDLNPEKRNDWNEVHNYVKAINQAITDLEKLPLCNRLIQDTHRTLLTSGRGAHKTPGEFRTSQNWIGGASLSDAVFIPPAHTELPDLMSDFEAFLNNEQIKIPHLVRIAIAHYQFETIHPFLDGNGRIGRLLITLYLVSHKILEEPLLYLSDFFEKNKALYYDNLTLVRSKNDLAQWIKFFLTGVEQTAINAVATLSQILELKESIEQKTIFLLGKRTQNGMKLLHFLFKKPVFSAKNIQSELNLSPKSANDLIQIFIQEGIVSEITGFRRNRIFAFEKYLALFRS